MTDTVAADLPLGSAPSGAATSATSATATRTALRIVADVADDEPPPDDSDAPLDDGPPVDDDADYPPDWLRELEPADPVRVET